METTTPQRHTPLPERSTRERHGPPRQRPETSEARPSHQAAPRRHPRRQGHPPAADPAMRVAASSPRPGATHAGGRYPRPREPPRGPPRREEGPPAGLWRFRPPSLCACVLEGVAPPRVSYGMRLGVGRGGASAGRRQRRSEFKSQRSPRGVYYSHYAQGHFNSAALCPGGGQHRTAHRTATRGPPIPQI